MNRSFTARRKRVVTRNLVERVPFQRARGPPTVPNRRNKAHARPYGPHNPHPLSTLKTELVWEGKYDEYGNRREVDV